MEANPKKIYIFEVAALGVLAATAWTFYEYYFNQNFIVFTSEDQINQTIDTEFPAFAQYLAL